MKTELPREQMGQSLRDVFESRLAEFETRWAYMLGYGLALAVPGLVLPLVASCVAYSLLFPVCMVVAVVGPAPRPQKHKVRVFWTAHWVLKRVLRWTVGSATKS